MTAIAIAAAGASVVVTSSGCHRKVTAEECTAMLDRYVDMTIAADPALANLSPAQTEAAREMKKAIRKGDKAYRRVHDQCESEVKRGEYRCAMDAKTPNDWEACID